MANLNAKIIDQVEHYFGNENLSHDMFFHRKMKEDHGWIPIDILLRCRAVLKLTRNKQIIAAALEDSKLVDVSEDGQKVRRKPEFPLPDNMPQYFQDLKKRSVFIRGFPHSANIEEILQFLNTFGNVVNVITQKHKHSREFRGSLFATFKERAEAENFLHNENTRNFHGAQLVRMMQNDYSEELYSTVIQSL